MLDVNETGRQEKKGSNIVHRRTHDSIASWVKKTNPIPKRQNLLFKMFQFTFFSDAFLLLIRTGVQKKERSTKTNN